MVEDFHIPQETKQEKVKTRKRSRGLPPASKIFLFLMVATLWGGMIYGAYYYAKDYIDSSIRTVQQTNAMNVQVLNDRLNSLSSDIQDIKEALESTDETLSSSDMTQRELSNKIRELDTQLQELQKSLMILKEAPNAPR